MRSAGQDLTAKKILHSSWLPKGLLGLLSILLFLKAAVFISRALSVLKFPYEWSTMDGYFIYYGLRLISGRPIYFDYDSLLMPFEYVPLYASVIGVLAKVLGPAVWYERCFSIVCSLFIGVIIALVVRRHTGNRFAAASAGLMFLGPASLSVWYIVRGIDILAALLALLAVFIIEEARQKGGLRIVLSAIACILAFYTKQTTIFAIFAGVLCLFCEDRKKGLLMAGGFGLGVAAILLLFQYLTEGFFFDNAFLTTADNPFYVSLLLRFVREYLLCLFVALPIALFQAFRGLSRRPNIWTLYFFLTLLSALLSGKAGAALSYFVPLFSATCICVGLFLGDSRFAGRRPLAYIVILIFMIVQAFAFFGNYVPIPTQKNYDQAQLLDGYIKSNPGRILTERIDSFAVLNGRELNIEAVQFPILVMRRKYDPLLLMQAIERAEFSLIIYSGIQFGGVPAVKRSIFENYSVLDKAEIGLFYGETTFLVLTPR